LEEGNYHFFGLSVPEEGRVEDENFYETKLKK
jgi:hypothetical protein